jgi:hypothetical protein
VASLVQRDLLAVFRSHVHGHRGPGGETLSRSLR